MDKQDAMLSALSKTSETALSQHNPIGTGRFSYSTLSNVVLPPLVTGRGQSAARLRLPSYPSDQKHDGYHWTEALIVELTAKIQENNRSGSMPI